MAEGVGRALQLPLPPRRANQPLVRAPDGGRAGPVVPPVLQKVRTIRQR